MSTLLLPAISAEWIKRRRTFSHWMVIAGGFFIPSIICIVLLCYPDKYQSLQQSGHFWEHFIRKAWNMFSFFFLPMGVVLAVSLITQLEFRSNTWKQLQATPASYPTIFFSKLIVLLLMLLQLFLLFNAGLLIAAFLPPLFYTDLSFPWYPLPVQYLVATNLHYYLFCIPLLLLQYLISLQSRNFLIPIGTGLALVVFGMFVLSWRYAYLIPPAYTALYYIRSGQEPILLKNLYLYSFIYSILFLSSGYLLFIWKKDKS